MTVVVAVCCVVAIVFALVLFLGTGNLMEQNPQNIHDQKYFFQAIEMANEEASSELDLDADFFSWKVVKRRQKPQRRYTVSHAAPPAPPSTPTSLSKEHDPLSELSMPLYPECYQPTDSGVSNTNGIGSSSSNGHGNAAENDECRLGSLLYILDYAPKYKKKLKEQQRTDIELAELFKVITITGGSGNGRGNLVGGSGTSSAKSSIEHGVNNASRKIRRPNTNAGLFKIHPTRDLHDEDSLSAPEFDAATEENMVAARPWRRLKVCKRRYRNDYRPLIKELESMKRMDEVVDTFDSTMTFQSAQ